MSKTEFVPGSGLTHTKSSPSFTPKIRVSVRVWNWSQFAISSGQMGDLFFLAKHFQCDIAASMAFVTVDPEIVHISFRNVWDSRKSLSLNWDNNDPVAAVFTAAERWCIYALIVTAHGIADLPIELNAHVRLNVYVWCMSWKEPNWCNMGRMVAHFVHKRLSKRHPQFNCNLVKETRIIQ